MVVVVPRLHQSTSGAFQWGRIQMTSFAVFVRRGYIFEESGVSCDHGLGPFLDYGCEIQTVSGCCWVCVSGLDCDCGCCWWNIDVCDRRRGLCCGSSGGYHGSGPFQYQPLSLSYVFLYQIFSVYHPPPETVT